VTSLRPAVAGLLRKSGEDGSELTIDTERFSETESPRSQDPVKEMPVMHLNVPRKRAVDANVRAREKIGHYLLGTVHNDWRSENTSSPV